MQHDATRVCSVCGSIPVRIPWRNFAPLTVSLSVRLDISLLQLPHEDVGILSVVFSGRHA